MGLLIGDLVRSAAAACPTATVATLGDGRLTFGDLDRRSNQIAHTLRARGVGHRDHVVWWGETSLDAFPIFAAVAKVGAVFAPLNARYQAAEAVAVAGYANPALVVTDAAHAPMTEDWDVPTVAHDRLHADADAAATDDACEPALDERDTHVLFFTSGSTGRPKGVVLSHRANALRAMSGMAADGTGSTVCMFPLFHMAGWTMALGALHARRPLHFVTTGTADDLLHAVAHHRATRLYLIPAVWTRVLAAEPHRYDLSSLRSADTGTSATPPELVAAIRDALPDTTTTIVYGSTEAGSGAVLSPDDVLRKPGSVGRAAPGVTLRLADDGEVCVRSEYLMDGYYEQPEATAEVLRDGWYHTGDLGSLDDEGYLSIIGRARDILRTGGETVAPLEVEDVLRDHPAVADVAVVGIADVEWGEVVCAVVVAEPGRADDLTVAALRTFCEARLAPYKHPRRVELVDALPRTPATGQIQRTLLVEQIVGRANSDGRPG